MKISVVIITYNRLELLKECIEAIKSQTLIPNTILVINNSSTDGTGEWLATVSDLCIITLPNRGGSWGFNEGIKQAYKNGADWIWIMDDDSIPQKDALEKLVAAQEFSKATGDNFGFFASKVLFTDNTIHLMNLQKEMTHFTGKVAANVYKENNIIPIEYSSFVSLFLSRNVVTKIGLPYKEFFIWCDDFEYTVRTLKNNFSGGLVTNSIVIHKTPTNYKNDIFLDAPSNLWKYKYGLRNELFIRKINKGFGSYYRNIFKRLFFLPFSILLKRKNNRFAFIKVSTHATLSAIRFNPKIEFVDETNA